jgi:RNA polymerase sigma factor (sigma-70 family)
VEDVAALVAQAQTGDIEAYGTVVRRFQAMACGYGYSVLGDFHLAQDAAQEAFVEAYRLLDSLREPAAFPGWFRRIVFKHCDRLTRRKRVATVALDSAGDVPDAGPDPGDAAEADEMRRRVMDAIQALPDHERAATLLFYIDGYSQSEVADFLEVPVTTVKNRLHRSRKRLKERMLDMVEETLKGNAPDERFSQEVIAELRGRPRPLETKGHPVRVAFEAIREALPEYECIDGDEVVDKSDPAGVYDSHENVYHVDDEKVLRSETTVTMIREAAGRTPPVRLITAGRVFRPAQEDKRHRKVFHQAEVLHIGADVTPDVMKATLLTAVQAVLGPVDPKWVPHAYERFEDSCELEIKAGSEWARIAGCGMMKRGTLEGAGYDPEAVKGMAFAVGLEWLAMLKLDLDDIEALWKPPYVPER